MNNITNSPKEDKGLFVDNIVKLRDAAISILESGELDSVQETAVCSYTNALVDLYKEDNRPTSELSEVGDVANLIDEMWQKVNGLVEDTQFRKMFILICKQVIYVKSWTDDDIVGEDF